MGLLQQRLSKTSAGLGWCKSERSAIQRAIATCSDEICPNEEHARGTGRSIIFEHSQGQISADPLNFNGRAKGYLLELEMQDCTSLPFPSTFFATRHKRRSEKARGTEEGVQLK